MIAVPPPPPETAAITTDGDDDEDGELLAVKEGEAVGDGVREGEGVVEMEGVADGVTEMVGVEEGVGELVGEEEGGTKHSNPENVDVSLAEEEDESDNVTFLRELRDIKKMFRLTATFWEAGLK
jgi:hypothetical protein